MRLAFAAALGSLVVALAAAAAPEPTRYRYDPVHTQVMFVADHLGFSRPVGRFTRVDGVLAFDPDDWSTARCEATIAVDSLWLGDAVWEKKVLSDAFLDASRHPTMRFECERAERIDAKRGRLFGALTIRGVTRPVELELRVNRIGRHTFSLAYVAGFSATGTIRRSDYGITRMLPAVGDEIEIRLEVEAIRD
ncbi:MAG TPA: YceI family protein [Candidatus Saccharimonadia bacterium]|nr:YceI family protein [Candidatus Saccharimonadia bacterium]